MADTATRRHEDEVRFARWPRQQRSRILWFRDRLPRVAGQADDVWRPAAIAKMGDWGF
jgi:hypothetical protein